MGVTKKNYSGKPGRKPRDIRAQNRKILLDLYHKYDELSVTEISKLAGLSRTTVMKVVLQLLDEKLLIESGKRQHNESGGKKPSIYRFNSKRSFIISIYIQYEIILLRVYDLKYNTIKDDSAEINKTSEFNNVVKKIRTMLARSLYEDPVFSKADYLACIVGLHGNIDHDTGICLQATHFHSWGLNKNISRILEQQLGLTCPVYVDNWIRLKAFGENRMELAGKHESVLLLDAGWHGVGIGILQNGELYQGKHYIAGEIGHFRINDEDKEECFCGSSGCFEQQIMIERLRKQVKELSYEYPDSPLLIDIDRLDFKRIFKAADAGDAAACRIMDSVIHWFSLIISYLLLFFDPEVLYIEGDYAGGCRYFEKGLDESIKQMALPRIKRDNVVRYSRSGTDAVLLGAAVFAFDRYFPAETEPVSEKDHA